EFHLIHDGALDEFLRAEPVIDDRAGAQAAHFRLHGATLVSRRPVLDAENGVKVALVLNDHAGTQLCRFYHRLLLIPIGELPACRSVWKLVPRIDYLRLNYSGTWRGWSIIVEIGRNSDQDSCIVAIRVRCGYVLRRGCRTRFKG